MKKHFLTSLFTLSLLAPFVTGCFSLPSSGGKEGGDPEEDTPSIHIKEDDSLVKHVSGETNIWYTLDLPLNGQYHLSCDLGDYTGSNYSLVYEFSVNDTYKNVCSIDTNNNITTIETAQVGDRADLKIKMMKKGKSYALEIMNIFITVGDQYANVKAILTSRSEEVTIGDSGYNFDFNISIPMSGKFYPMPEIEITNFENYSLTFEPKDENSVIFTGDDRDISFMIDVNNTTSYGTKYFYINVLDSNDVFIKRFTCKLTLTHDDPDVLQVFYGNNRTQLRDNDELLIEKSTDNTPFVCFYDNYEINALSGSIKVEIEDTSVVSLTHGSTSYGYSRILKTVGVGETNITITYGKDSDQEKVIHSKVKVFDGKNLIDIYVPLGADAFTIVDNNVYVTGKIYAVYEVGEPEAINGSDDLGISLEDTSDENMKKVTLTYTYKGVSKSVSLNVPVTKSNSKTKLTQNYHSYWENNNHVSTSTKGDVKVLAIPIWFTDSSNFINEEKGHKEQIINDLTLSLFGNNDEVTYRSLKTYYLEESLGELKVSGTVAPWYECGKASTYYGDKDTNITTLVADAVKWYFDESGTSETRSDYDANNDGKIDHVIAYYGANYHCMRNGYPVSSGWCRKLYNSYTYESSIPSYTWVSALSIYGLSGLSANAYKQLEKDNLSSIHGINGAVTIHEFAHALGIPDIYDTSMKSTPAGAFTMQSSDKGGHDPYNLMAMGFASPYVFDSSDTTLDDEITFTIHDSQSSGDMILLTPHWDESKQIFDEYILLDLYTPTGLNAYHALSMKGANSVGIRVWHVNAEVDSTTHRHKYTNNSVDTNYDLIHYIRNDVNEEYRSLSVFGEDNIFKQGDSFSMEAYKSQLFNGDGKLDSGLSLGWSFEVTNISVDEHGSATATIKLVRA